MQGEAWGETVRPEKTGRPIFTD